MLYEIKVLKAPWPEGAKVGDVIDMPYLPAWAEGKCSVALDGAQADFTYDPREVTGGEPAGSDTAVNALGAQVVDLREKLAAAEKDNGDLKTGKESAEAEVKDLREKLAAAEAAHTISQKAAKK